METAPCSTDTGRPWQENRRQIEAGADAIPLVCALCDAGAFPGFIPALPAKGTDQRVFCLRFTMTDKTEIYKALSALVAYDPETGLFIWKRREEITRWDKAFNAQFAGRECGSIDKHGYQVIGFSHEGKLNRLKAHRLAWLIVHGKLPDGEIDHIKRNRADNRIANIRDVSRAINHRNVSMLRNNTSGVTGVCWHKTKGKWQARAKIEGRYRHIGLFTCIHEAESAVKAFREKHGFTDSHGDAST